MPNPLVANGQYVNFELKAQVPEKLIREKQTYKLDIFYEYGMKREDIATYSFKFGEFVYENGTPTVIRQLVFPYAPEKNPGRLLVQGRAMDDAKGDVRYTSPKEVAVGLVTTPLLLVRNNSFSFLADTYQDAASQPGTVVFYFDPNKTALQSNHGPEEQLLQQYVLDNVSTQQITITASQSPDETGPNLARKRAKALEELYRKKLGTLDYSGKKVTIQTAVEIAPMDLLKQRLQTSPLPKPDKKEALSILESSQSQTEKLKALRQLPVYTYIEHYIYPGLRAARLEVDYNRNRKPDYELYVLAQKMATENTAGDVLTEQELQHAATLTPLLDEKRKLYEAAIKTSDKWPAYYNLGVVYNEMARKEYRPAVKQALLSKAIHNLTYASFRNPSLEVYYSLASAYHQQGALLDALKFYDSAIKAGGDEQLLQQVFADKAALEIEAGQYNEAIESLRYAGSGYQTNMNLGLSYLLKENYEGAAEFYTQALAEKPNDGLAHYSLALIGARTDDAQLLEQHLRKAVHSDKALMEKAINDLEFAPYRDKAPYKDALLQQ
ncbi:tetratricopeptide repeat protein [Pontibacter sp. E15-1]|uniref:tetratricopeptide repeat protein n=1 Tax=Pontibacter sp. E15-1 TaxID=2919918 RepID=UPI001F4FB68F|nr:tetratricopeptide repeat protein [Pontibacter sp. E15-1]MCJ8166388.1 tetratricopeptide repeat protein [Pontibacter sp. E15-1]